MEYYGGIDLGVRSAAAAIVNEHGELLFYEHWKFDTRNPFYERLEDFAARVDAFCNDHPNARIIGIERPWVGRNYKTALELGMMFGVTFAMVSMQEDKPMEIFPRQAKKALTGSGKATKEDMREALHMQFNVDDNTKFADIADAVGIALAARSKAQKEKLNNYV